MSATLDGRTTLVRCSGAGRVAPRRLLAIVLRFALLLLLALATGALGPGNGATAGMQKAAVSSTETASVRPAAIQYRTISFSYDQAGRLVEANYGGGKSVAYTYDRGGNLLSRLASAVAKVYLPVVVRDR